MEDERLYWCVIDNDSQIIVDIFDTKEKAERYLKCEQTVARINKYKINYSITMRTRDAL